MELKLHRTLKYFEGGAWVMELGLHGAGLGGAIKKLIVITTTNLF